MNRGVLVKVEKKNLFLIRTNLTILNFVANPFSYGFPVSFFFYLCDLMILELGSPGLLRGQSAGSRAQLLLALRRLPWSQIGSETRVCL